MKHLKPQKLALLHKTYEYLGQCHFAVTVGAYFPFAQANALLPEIAMWKFVARELGKDAALDMCVPKKRAEAMVIGKCFSPQGRPAQSANVRLKIGPENRPVIDKTLRVFGDRVWRRTLTGVTPSDPQPFTEMPVNFERAFGGEGYAQNPIGRGAKALPPAGDAAPVHLLPNIEDPQRLIASPGDRPAPASFSPLDFTWPQRFSKAGTYDEKWLEHRFPGYADDIDWTIFNAAAPDQWLDLPLTPGVRFEISGMHPTRATVSGSAPDLTLRTFIKIKTGDGLQLRSIEMRPDTLWLFPEHEVGIQIYRGVTIIGTDDATDIAHIIIGAESANEPKGSRHYEEVLAQRLDPAQASIAALRDDHLMPAGEPPELGLGPENEAQEKLVTTQGTLHQNQRRRAEKELKKSKERLRGVREQLAPLGAMGAAALARIDEALARELPPAAPPAKLEDLPKIVQELNDAAAKAKADAVARHADSMQQLRDTVRKAGLDPEKLLADARKRGGGKPVFSAQAQLQKLEQTAASLRAAGTPSAVFEKLLADPNLRQKLEASEQQMKQAYQRFAHMFPTPPELEPEAASKLRETVAARMKGDRNLSGLDLTGADLAGMDLKGANLRAAILDATNLEGVDLSGADLGGSVLARANLSKAKLTGALLVDANIGHANLQDADLSGGVDLSGACLAFANLSRAKLDGARLERTDFLGARLQGTDLSGAQAPEAKFIEASFEEPPPVPESISFPEPKPPGQVDMTGARFAGASMPKALFYQCILANADFAGADLTSATMLSVKGADASFQGANLTNLRVVQSSALPGANFTGARMERANLRGTDLSGARLDRALLKSADLSECEMANACLDAVNAAQLRLVKTNLHSASLLDANLYEAVLQKTRLQGAKLNGANLYCADLLRVVADARTDIGGANLAKTRPQGLRKS